MTITAEKNRFYGDKGWDSELDMFAKVATNPGQWLGTAAEHLYASEIMLPHIENERKIRMEAMMEQKTISTPPSLTGIYLFHCALAIDNILKSTISYDHSEAIKADIEAASKMPKILLGHDLLVLAERARLDLDLDEEFILKFLTRYGVWSGKYRQPIKNSENGLTEKLSDGNHYMTGGYDPESIPKYFRYSLNLYNQVKEKVNKVM